MTTDLLREYISMLYIESSDRSLREAKISAGTDYMRKEGVREALQALIVQMVADGRLHDQASLDEAFQAFDMSVNALKMVPFEVWQRLSSPSTITKGRSKKV